MLTVLNKDLVPPTSIIIPTRTLSKRGNIPISGFRTFKVLKKGLGSQAETCNRAAMILKMSMMNNNYVLVCSPLC